MKITKRQLRRIIREEAKSTKKYDDDSALKGGQGDLPDALQKGIIDKVVDDREEDEEEDKKKDESLRLTLRGLRKMIRESIITESEMISIVSNPYEDVDDINILANYALRDDMQGALQDKELQYYIDNNEAAGLVDESMGWLKHVGNDAYEMPAPEGWDLDKIYTFFSKFENEAYKAYSKKAKAASAAAPNRAERKAIGRAFTYDDVSEDEIAYITFQLRRKGGKVVNINMEDHDSRLGNMTTGMSEEEATRLGTTLDKIEKTLRDGGAKERKKRKPVRRSTPYYD